MPLQVMSDRGNVRRREVRRLTASIIALAVMPVSTAFSRSRGLPETPFGQGIPRGMQRASCCSWLLLPEISGPCFHALPNLVFWEA
jgi:hypothetical protein